jgi:uncharacterized membrane protein
MHQHKGRDDRPSDNLLRLLGGMTFIVALTTIVIIGPDGIAALWSMISPF